MKKIIILIVLSVLFMFSCQYTLTDPDESFTCDQTKVIASDGVEEDYFGYSVSVSSDGNTIVSGAFGDDDNGSKSGSIYIYKWNGTSWGETKVIALDGASSEEFGKSVSISSDGNTLVSGARFDEGAAGSIYIYKWNGTSWDETKLIASDGGGADEFGYSVSVSSDGNTIVSGARHDNKGGNASGSIYIYKWTGASWDETNLVASDGDSDDYLGSSVAISDDGNTIVSGAWANDDNGNNSGSIYIFKWNGTSWDETKVIASDGVEEDYFGYSVSISLDGNTVVSGARGDDDKGDFAGSIYIYKWNGTSWGETKVTALDGAPFNQFGYSVSVSSDGNTVVSGNISGSSYINKWNGTSWNETKLLSCGSSGDGYGSSVSISSDGNTIVTGAWGDDDKGDFAGSIYIYNY